MVGKGRQAEKDRAQKPDAFRYLAMLDAAGMPLHQILILGEKEGLSVDELLLFATNILRKAKVIGSPEHEALALVFGCLKGWESLFVAAGNLGLQLLRTMLYGHDSYLEALLFRGDRDFPGVFRKRVLRRLGYPACLAKSLHPRIKSPKHLEQVMAWLGAGEPIISEELELCGFTSISPAWGDLFTLRLVLKNGICPASISWLTDRGTNYYSQFPGSLRIERVKGLRHLDGLTNGKVILLDCPDLEGILGSCHDLQVEDCPRLGSVWIGPGSNRVSLKHCSSLRSIKPTAGDELEDQFSMSDRVYELENLVIEDCGQFRLFPPRMRISDRLHLSGVGPIEQWPWNFQIGDSFLITDCPKIEVLPPVEVQGSLVVRGNSGLRRLSPGTAIGKHLDLRACSLLEDIPRGVTVGGSIYLPEHLNHRRRAHARVQGETPALLEVPQADLYESLRTMLMGLQFTALVAPKDRPDARKLAQGILLGMRVRLAQEPQIESLMLWTASEVWRDLSEEVWAAWSPWGNDRNESDEDLPMAWFLAQVHGEEAH